MRSTAVALAALAVACGGSAASAPATRPATKSTCATATIAPGLGWTIVDRRLVPYSAEVQGVEETFARAEQQLELVSGGYFDELTERYDDLVERGTATVRGATATLLSGHDLNGTVEIALWRETGQPPCDAHAVVGLKVNRAEFDTVIGTLT
jgi:hypothetical protein